MLRTVSRRWISAKTIRDKTKSENLREQNNKNNERTNEQNRYHHHSKDNAQPVSHWLRSVRSDVGSLRRPPLTARARLWVRTHDALGPTEPVRGGGEDARYQDARGRHRRGANTRTPPVVHPLCRRVGVTDDETNRVRAGEPGFIRRARARARSLVTLSRGNGSYTLLYHYFV